MTLTTIYPVWASGRKTAACSPSSGPCDRHPRQPDVRHFQLAPLAALPGDPTRDSSSPSPKVFAPDGFPQEGIPCR